MGPVYLGDLLIYYKPKREGLRHDPLSLEIPGTELVTYGDSTFRVAAAKAWNQLPKKIRTAETVDHFKADLKTHLFKTIIDCLSGESQGAENIYC